MAPEVGFEPTTNRLTADRSTTELLRSVVGHDTNLDLGRFKRKLRPFTVTRLEGQSGRKRLLSTPPKLGKVRTLFALPQKQSDDAWPT
jgi:hypothetical protein